MLLPGVFEKIALLRAAGHRIAIASNQADVALGTLTLEQSEELVKSCAAKMGGIAAWRICPFDPHGKKKLKGRPNPYACDDPTRKPHPGMILELMEDLKSPPEDTIMVGDKKADKSGSALLKPKHFSNLHPSGKPARANRPALDAAGGNRDSPVMQRSRWPR